MICFQDFSTYYPRMDTLKVARLMLLYFLKLTSVIESRVLVDFILNFEQISVDPIEGLHKCACEFNVI